MLQDELKLKNQESWDNSGMQIGSLNSDIKTVMLTLDADKRAVAYALENKADLIISHHPFFFGSVKSIDFDSYDGSIVKMIINSGMNLYSMHTSLDMAEEGVTTAIAQKLGIEDYLVLHKVNDDGSGYGGFGTVKETNIREFALMVKKSLDLDYVRLYAPDEDITVNKAAFCGGSGSEFILDALLLEADVYITGDIKYHQAQDALKNNLCIIDAGHFGTECPALIALKEALLKNTDLNVLIYGNNTVKEIII